MAGTGGAAWRGCGAARLAAGLADVLPVKFDVSVVAGDGAGGGLVGGIQFSSALFDAATAGRLAGHLGVVLAGVAGDGGVRVSGVAVVSGGERAELVSGWGGAGVAVPGRGGWVAGRVLARAAECPDAVAVVAGGRRVSYGWLAGRAAGLAGVLRGRGAGRGSVVGVCLERGPGAVAAMLGAWLAGAAYLPLDPGYPAGRLAFMAADAGAVVVVTSAALAGRLGGEAALVVVDDPAAAAGVAGSAAGAVVPGGDEAAYVIYTSGSTGAPKGVAVGHGSLAGLLDAAAAAAGTGPGGAWSACHSLSFDFSVWEIWGALAGGGRLRAGRAGGGPRPGGAGGAGGR